MLQGAHATEAPSPVSAQSAFGPETDTLYVSNGGGDAPVTGFSAANGNEQISFVSDVKAPISGQHGVLVAGGELILVNQSTCLASFARIRAIENFLKFSAGFGKRDRPLIPRETNTPTS